MEEAQRTLEPIRQALEAEGLLLRGGFHPSPDDNSLRDIATLLLVGNAGPALWRAFQPADRTGPDPLNRWTRRVLSGIADRFGATALFPFEGPPYLPFFAWAKRAEPVTESPIGMMIHPEYGLWHAWRGALAFTERLALPETPSTPAPCESCSGRPCLTGCPVDAFREGRYDVAACADHLRTQAGADCVALGCRARRTCPAGADYIYAPDQARFHMDAFLRNQPS